MYSAVVLMLLSLASAGTQAASIAGSVKVVEGGRSLNCVGVLLIPRSPEIDAAVEQQFGRLDDGVRTTITPTLAQGRQDLPQSSRTSRCGGRFAEKFAFSDVAPGEYYLTMTAVPKHRYDDGKFRPKTVEMMQRVSVAPASSVTVDLKYSG